MSHGPTSPAAADPFWLGCALVALSGAVVLGPGAARADINNNPYSGNSTLQQQVIDSGPGNTRPKGIFDAKNPGDLINTLRKGAALDDATPPADAIDRALRALEAQNVPATKPPLKGP